MSSIPNGLPGMLPTYQSTPRNIFYADQQFAQYLMGPLVIDGTLSSNPQNTPDTWDLFAGSLMGKETATNKYRNSIIGAATGAISSGDSTVTVDASVAAEVARLISVAAGNVNLTLIGPPSASGTIALTSVTATAASGTTITLSTTVGVNKIAGTLVCPADGSQYPICVLANVWGTKIIDQMNTTRVDVQCDKLCIGGGVLNTQYLWPVVPTDSSILAWIKSQLRSTNTGWAFSDDFIGS